MEVSELYGDFYSCLEERRFMRGNWVRDLEWVEKLIYSRVRDFTNKLKQWRRGPQTSFYEQYFSYRAMEGEEASAVVELSKEGFAKDERRG